MLNLDLLIFQMCSSLNNQAKNFNNFLYLGVELSATSNSFNSHVFQVVLMQMPHQLTVRISHYQIIYSKTLGQAERSTESKNQTR